MNVPLFVANPKGASTSIRAAFPHHRMGVPTLQDCRTIHQPLSSPWVQERIRRHSLLFGVVRHPLDRFVSAWAWFKTPFKRNLPENYLLQALLQGGDINDLVRVSDLNLLGEIIPHFGRQVDFFKPGRKRREMDMLLHFESLDEDFELLCEAMGVRPFTLPHRRQSRREPWKTVLSDESIQTLVDWYQADFKAFGYDLEVV
jgi:hypothetical protein